MNTEPLDSPTTVMENVGIVNAPTAPLPAIPGGQKDDPAKQVTDPWVSRLTTILTASGITGLMVFDWFKSADPELQKIGLISIAQIVSVFLICHTASNWQKRSIESNPARINVK